MAKTAAGGEGQTEQEVGLLDQIVPRPSVTRKRLGTFLVLGAGLLLVASVLALLGTRQHATGAAPRSAASTGDTLELSEVKQKDKGKEKEEEKEEEEKSKCTSGGDNCHETQCCQAVGLQCYEQDDKYAQCRPSCTAGPDPTHWDGNEWSCKELGSRTAGEDACGESWHDCSKSHCCKDTGFQCYAKNKTHATCKSECVAGGPDLSDWDDNAAWSCEELGERSPSTQDWVQGQCSEGLDNCVGTKCCKQPNQQCFLQNDYYGNCMTACVGVGDGDPWSCAPLGARTPGPATKANMYAPWVLSKCSLPYEGCQDSKCCLGYNMQCYEKNKDWSSCMEGCKAGPNAFDKNETWSCKEKGPRSYGLATKGFPSLYCFSLMRIGSYEEDLMKGQLEKRAGIFDCDEFAVLTADGQSTLGDGPAGPVTSIQFQGAPVVTSQDNTAGNTELFVNAWDAVVKAKSWKNHSWIVKADPDAVVIPERLRWHLAPRTGEHVFVLNCNKYPGPNYPMVYGALEVFANSAIQAWAEHGHDCYAPNTYGEDFYITRCMDHIGVGRLLDEQILGDNLCMGADCANGWTSAFHPYKDIAAWEGCYNTAIKTLRGDK